MINSDYNFEVKSNDNIVKAVKTKFKKNQDLIKSLIHIIYNNENERNTIRKNKSF